MPPKKNTPRSAKRSGDEPTDQRHYDEGMADSPSAWKTSRRKSTACQEQSRSSPEVAPTEISVQVNTLLPRDLPRWLPKQLVAFAKEAVSWDNWWQRTKIVLAAIFLKVQHYDDRLINQVTKHLTAGGLDKSEEDLSNYIGSAIQEIQEIIVNNHMKVANVWLRHTETGQAHIRELDNAR